MGKLRTRHVRSAQALRAGAKIEIPTIRREIDGSLVVLAACIRRSATGQGAPVTGDQMKKDRERLAIVREAFYTLTGDFYQALVLNQMVFYQKLVKDFPRFIEQENERG